MSGFSDEDVSASDDERIEQEADANGLEQYSEDDVGDAIRDGVEQKGDFGGPENMVDDSEDGEGNELIEESEEEGMGAAEELQAVQATLDTGLPQDSLLLEGPAAREAALLQLQVDELVKESRVDYDDSSIKDHLEKLTSVLMEMPEQDIAPELADDYLHILGLSAQRPLHFLPPEDVELTGSFRTQTMAQPARTVDVLLRIPRECFYHKDHVNHQYHARVALYQAACSARLLKLARFKQQRWEYLHGDVRKPVLVITPRVKSSDASSVFRIRLLPAISASAFPLPKLRPSRNNLRSVAQVQEGSLEPALLPTPHYNASIMQDVLAGSCREAIQAAAVSLPHFTDAVVLLKVWAQQHGLEGHPDDLGIDLLEAFAAHLSNNGILARAMTPLQMMRAVLKSLADPKTFQKGVSLARPSVENRGFPPPPPVEEYVTHFDVVLVDPTGWHNLAAHVSASALRKVQGAARRTLELLQKVTSAEAVFDAAFLPRHMRPMASYDYFWRVALPPPDAAQLLAADLSTWRAQEETLEKLAKQALGTRIISIRSFRRPLDDAAMLGITRLQHGDILLAAQVDASAINRAVDIGPAANSPEAVAFRKFWGDKSELRRFQDGKISEAVAWEGDSSQRHTIADQIMRFVLDRHIPGASLQAFSGMLDWALWRKGASPKEQLQASRQADAALLRLGKQLRSLTSLALKVVAVQPVSGALRHTTSFDPLPHPAAGAVIAKGAGVPRCLDPLEVLVQLEGSGKWPDNPEAFKKMKAALGVQLAEELFTGFGLRAEASEDCADVFVDGFAFRLRLASERDEAIARQASKASSSYVQLRKRMRHHGFISQVSAMHPAFRGTARLASRWVATHLLSNHIAAEAVELLVAAVFSPGTGLDPPGSALAGFLRFLRLLSESHWRERPLIVDPDNEMEIAQRRSTISAFTKAKAAGIAPSLPISTPADPASADWTATRPSHQVVQRTVALAKRSAAILQETISAGSVNSTVATAAVYRPALADFDAVIVMRRDSLPSADLALQTADGSKRNIEAELRRAGFGRDEEGEPLDKRARAALRTIPADVVASWGAERIARELLVGFDPVRILLGHLEERYGHLGLFCVDVDGGEVIGIKWHSQAFQPQPLQQLTAHTMLPLENGQLTGNARAPKKARLSARRATTKAATITSVIPDIMQVLAEIRTLGAGLVSDVRLRHELEP